ncbi:hypothetical protein ONS95_012094 [Cadophora gregata]|uniref:uncharacterized protein n=1 Tax=Cadophora gregata TaxID=51156 RepID=UPI0026DBBEF5|nr:uncharacterized protein ONS95_012094 [Cadophora gregata]KAK0117769.1 hypothetical protein ONS95_012094 [Cadophora gregata]KAK0122818.1 hypothetical protein ONS96_009851 [Cadophora gregata f. sp. sojae]
MDPIDAHSTVLADIMIRCVNFISTIKSASLVDSMSTYLEAVEFDTELREWDAQLPEGWRHKTVPTANTSEFIYEGHIHLFEDIWRARMYTDYCMLSQVLLEHQANLAMFATDETVQQEEILRIISELAHDICASISCQLTRTDDMENGRRQIPPMSSVFLLLLSIPSQAAQWMSLSPCISGVFACLGILGTPLESTRLWRWSIGQDAAEEMASWK